MSTPRQSLQMFSVFCVFVSLLLANSLWGAAKNADGDADLLARFQEKEVLKLEWPETMVTYRVEFDAGVARADNMRLVGDGGREKPFQLWAVETHDDGSIARARISFMAELEKGGTYDYRLMKGERNATAGSLDVSEGDDYLTLSNSLVAFRMPEAGTYEFEEPLSFGKGSHGERVRRCGREVESGIIPGPFQGLRLVDGRWVGGSYFWDAGSPEPPKATAYTCEITERGPLFVEGRIKYSFDNGGYYQMTARLLRKDPAVRVDEQYDMGRTGNGYKWRVVTSFTGGWKEGGWQPDLTFWNVSGGRVKGDVDWFEKRMNELGHETEPYKGRAFGSKKLNFEKKWAKVFDVAAWYPWSSSVQYFGLVDSADLRDSGANPENIPFVALVPIHAGTWRSSHRSYRTTMLFTHNAPDVDLHWPMMPEDHPNSLLHTGEYDPELPLTFVRRQWALFGGPFKYHDDLYQFRRYEGYVNLDDYKEWILDWEEDEEITYPRLFFGPELVNKLKGKLDEHPAGETLKELLYFSRDEERAQKSFKHNTGRNRWSGPLGQALSCARNQRRKTPWQSHFRHSQKAADWAPPVDELLSSGLLSPEKRDLLRQHIAALCEVMSEPDFNPRGSMVHLGNPNMPINRTMALAFAASLIPDHPRAEEWMDMIAEFERYKLAMNVAPKGAWSELISYFHASAPHLMQGGAVLGNAGRLDRETAELCTLPARFTLQLLTPKDPRFGTRIIPGWGHKGVRVGAHWLLAAGLIRDDNPDLARSFAWAWNELGQPQKTHHSGNFGKWATINADVLEQVPDDYVAPELRSTRLPGFGAVMRAHAGEPGETYLSYRQGYQTSHSDPNQGDFVLYARGAPLVPKSLKTYALVQRKNYKKLHRNFGWHNRVRFGSKGNTGGWPGGGSASQVHRMYTGKSVDYLRGKGDYGPQRWTRQIVFLKSKAASGPNYFVFRDSFAPRKKGKQLQKKWWYLRTLGSKERVRATSDSLEYESPYGPRFDVSFLQPDTIQAESRDVECKGPLYFAHARPWRRAHDMEPGHKATATETITVTAVGPIKAGQDIVSVLYPREKAEQKPAIAPIGDGAIRVKTKESTDYIFLSPVSFHHKGEKISFAGTCGAVRVYPDEVHLIIAEDSGAVSYGGTTLRSQVPALRVLARDKMKAETIEVRAPKNSIAFSPPKDAKEKPVQTGVKRYEFKDGFAYGFDAKERLEWEENGVRFVGRRGGVVVRNDGTVRMILESGETVSYKKLKSWGAGGPYDLTFHKDRITGRTAGEGRFLYVTGPPGLDRLPTLVIDGQTYALGTHNKTITVPVLEGKHEIEIRIIKQPPITRNWQQWNSE